jgi:hypothetical protein
MTELQAVRYPPAPYEHRDEAVAWRGGCWSARHGIPKRANPYLPQTQGHSAWLAGWLAESNQDDAPAKERQ